MVLDVRWLMAVADNVRKVVSVEAKADYVLALEFDDGTVGDFSVADRLYGVMFEPLKDPAVFNQVAVDEHGAVCWPNGADLAPDALYREVVLMQRE